MNPILIVGAGQAGIALAAKLRALGTEAPILMIGAEPAPPYQRPPLSKKYLLGEMERERLFLRPESFYAETGIELITGCAVTALDAATRTVTLADGRRIEAAQIALCTGADPIRLPAAMGGDLDGIYTMRSLTDADAMAPEIRPGARVLIVGGGYVGLEAAAVAAKKGLTVTLVEMAPRLLARVAGPETAASLRALHRAHGVDLREGTGLKRLTGANGRVSAAELSDGTTLPVDFVIIGIGVRPATALAEAAGIACENGVRVNAMGETSAPGIFAAGDCASFPLGDTRLRLESVPHAIDHAEAVAANMLGAATPYTPRPWFWSDQYDVKLQIAGLCSGYDRVVTRPGARPGTESHWYFAAGRLIAVDAIGDARAYMAGKRLIEAGITPDAAALADPGTPLNALPPCARAHPDLQTTEAP